MELLRIFLDENFKKLPDPKRDMIFLNVDNFGRQKSRKATTVKDFEVMYIVPQLELTEKSPEELQKEKENKAQDSQSNASNLSRPIKNIGDNSLYGGSVYSNNSRNSKGSKRSHISFNSRGSKRSKNSRFSHDRHSKKSGGSQLASHKSSFREQKAIEKEIYRQFKERTMNM
jgi:hypothetical protein